MLVLPERGGARGPKGFLRRSPLARRTTVLQVLRLLQVPDWPALYGSEELPVLLGGVQEESHGLKGQDQSLMFFSTCEARNVAEKTLVQLQRAVNIKHSA